MPKVIPFRAVRPPDILCERIVTRSYEAYSFKERQEIQAKNPDSFLHILNPEFESPVRLRGKKRYGRVREKYLDFFAQGKFQKDRLPSFYLYRNTENGITATGIVAAMSVREYLSGHLKIHEDTLQLRENRFADYLSSVQFNAEPVLVAYKDHPKLQTWCEYIAESVPQTSCIDDQKVLHEIWPITNASQLQEIQNYFSEIQDTFLMDGHHRTASSVSYANAQNQLGVQSSDANQYFMVCLLPESQLRIESFSRLLTDLGGGTPESVIAQLENNYCITPKGTAPWVPEKKHSFSMFLAGQFYQLDLKEIPKDLAQHPDKLDARILFDTILSPIFGIKDPRHDQRLKYLWDSQPAIGIRKAVDGGAFAAGFGLYPVAYADIQAIASKGLTMPPKSTYIKPKLLSGLTIYEL
ncbi:MAG: hypothetical protein RLZZ241_2416 [Bacteroidota bacterium]|jgi:uncharacterized protein (DUF1015 family)